VMLSTGMSDYAEIDAAVEVVQQRGAALCVMQCTSLYPCPPERVGLNLLAEYRDRYSCAVGLSDHSGTPFPGIVAASLGAQVVEVHLTLSREMFGPDVIESLTPSELRQLVEGIRFAETMRANPADKASVAEDVAPLRDIFMKSVVANRGLETGHLIAHGDLAAKKPAGGIPSADLPQLLGRRLRRSLAKDEVVQREDLEEPSA